MVIESILLIAGDESARRLVSETVGDQYRLQIAADMREAMEQAPGVDLVLIDVPSGAVAEACRELRGAVADGDIAIVAVVDDLDSGDRALTAGSDDLLIRPVRATELLVRLRAVLAVRRAREAAVRMDRERQDVITLFVHDLKSPLGAVMLNAAMLAREQALSDRARRCAQRITDASQNMRRMVLNLLDVTKGEEAAMAPHMAVVDPALIVSDVIASLAARAASSEHDVQLVAPASSIEVYTDPELLRRVLDNLLDNALTYAPSRTSIRVEVEVVDGALELRVRDEGPGISEALRNRLFQKYARGDGEELSESHHGLGLAFCRLAVEALRGSIEVRPNQPQGSVFCVSHPLHRADAMLDAGTA